MQVSGSYFPIVALHDINEGGTPYMGISPRRMRLCTHRPEREQEGSGRMSLCVFGFEGKITLFSFPKNPALREQWIIFFSRTATEFLKCVC